MSQKEIPEHETLATIDIHDPRVRASKDWHHQLILSLLFLSGVKVFSLMHANPFCFMLSPVFRIFGEMPPKSRGRDDGSGLFSTSAVKELFTPEREGRSSE